MTVLVHDATRNVYTLVKACKTCKQAYYLGLLRGRRVRFEVDAGGLPTRIPHKCGNAA